MKNITRNSFKFLHLENIPTTQSQSPNSVDLPLRSHNPANFVRVEICFFLFQVSNVNSREHQLSPFLQKGLNAWLEFQNSLYELWEHLESVDGREEVVFGSGVDYEWVVLILVNRRSRLFQLHHLEFVDLQEQLIH